jgi:hypothetical protein
MCAKQVIILKSLLGKGSNMETMMQTVDTVTKCDGWKEKSIRLEAPGVDFNLATTTS